MRGFEDDLELISNILLRLIFLVFHVATTVGGQFPLIVVVNKITT